MEEIALSVEAQREQAALRASVERMREERLALEAQNKALQALIEREKRLASHLREGIAASRAERQSIESEKSRILAVAGR
jgi:mannitol/fructose-specific phosphotransferase system IIA component